MLNRHHLRVKAMQALYAFENTRDTEFERAQQQITKILTPDWTEKAYIDDETLDEQRKEAHKYFLDYYLKENDFLALTGISSKTRNAVIKAIQYYNEAVRINRETNLLQLIQNTEKIHDIYIKFLLLTTTLSELVKNEKTIVQESHIRKYDVLGDFKMEKNEISFVISKHPKIQQAISRKNISWDKEMDYLREWYVTQIKTNEKYIAYNNKTTTSFEEDKEIMLYIFSDIIFGKKSVYYYSIKDCSITYSFVRRIIDKNGLEGVLRLVENAVNNVAKSFLSNLYSHDNAIEEEKLAKILIQHLKQKHAPIRKDAEKSMQRRERALQKGELIKEERPENVAEYSLKAIVDGFSEYLSTSYLHDVGFHPRNLNAINAGIAKMLDILDIEWNDSLHVLLQTHHDNINSQMYAWGTSQLLHWDEDVLAIESMVMKTLRAIQNELDTDFELFHISRNWSDDKDFMRDLYVNTLKNETEYETYLQEKSQNWHISRFAKIDRVILKMAIAEFVFAYSIPVKVSINEYVEVAKEYSTQKSKNFINGMLDSLSKDLIEKKIIRKSGLGMIDNK